MSEARRFLLLWTLAIVASTAAFSLYLGLRVKNVELGYELGRAHSRVARLREIRRVLALEAASYESPERVELVARSLLGMSEPTPDRIIPAGELPVVPEEQETPAERGSAPGATSAAPPRVAPPEEEPMEGPEPTAPGGPFAAAPGARP